MKCLHSHLQINKLNFKSQSKTYKLNLKCPFKLAPDPFTLCRCLYSDKSYVVVIFFILSSRFLSSEMSTEDEAGPIEEASWKLLLGTLMSDCRHVQDRKKSSKSNCNNFLESCGQC